MRRIIIEYFNNEYHIQLWQDGTIHFTLRKLYLSEKTLTRWMEEGVLL